MTRTLASAKAAGTRMETAVVGVDLSLTATGVCSDDGARLLVPPKGLDGLARLRWLVGAIDGAIDGALWAAARSAGASDVDVLVVLEGLAFAAHTGKASERAGLWWMVRDHVDPLPVAVVPPTCRAKYATGKGNAGKDAVLLAAAKRYPDAGIVDNNTADAAVLWAMGRDWLGDPVAVVPQTHRAAGDGCEWPAALLSGVRP